MGGVSTSLAGLVLALACLTELTAEASAQPAQEPTRSEPADRFDPATYGIVEFDEPKDLYQRLTEVGRCPVSEMAAERQPCAFVFYERVAGKGKQVSFKPIFKVESKDVIWAMHDKKLKKVSIANLYGDRVTLLGQTGEYRSFAIIGNAENTANCESGRPCLAQLVQEDMFLMYKTIPDMVVQKLWHGRRVDNGTNVIVR